MGINNGSKGLKDAFFWDSKNLRGGSSDPPPPPGEKINLETWRGGGGMIEMHNISD